MLFFAIDCKTSASRDFHLVSMHKITSVEAQRVIAIMEVENHFYSSCMLSLSSIITSFERFEPNLADSTWYTKEPRFVANA